MPLSIRISAAWFSGVTSTRSAQTLRSAMLAQRIVSSRVRRPSVSSKTVDRVSSPPRRSKERWWVTTVQVSTSRRTPPTKTAVSTQSGPLTRSITGTS